MSTPSPIAARARCARHDRPRARRRLWGPALALALAVGAAACAPTKIWRLEGDPPQAAAMTTPYVDLHPAADGARRFALACQQQRWEAAWAGLSKQTRGALSARANAVGGHGLDLIRPLPADASPGLRQLHLGDALSRFAVPEPRTYRVVGEPWPVDKPYDGRRLEAHVVVQGKATQREVIVTFEDDGWRVHNPRLAGPEQAGTP